MPYVNQSRARRRVNKKQFTMAMGYKPVGDLSSLLASGTSFVTKGEGLISQYVKPVLGGATQLVSLSKPAPGPQAALSQAVTYNPQMAQAAASEGGFFSSKIAGIPMPLVLGGAGVAAFLLLRKRR